MAPTDIHKPGRRAFLVGAGALVVSFSLPLINKRAGAASGPAVDAGSQLVPKDKVDSFIAILEDGRVIGCNGHVDLGTGLRTAFTQMVAEELDVPLSSVSMVMGDTDRTPNQGPTIASASIQTAAVPMRQAAAQARQFLLQRAANQWNVPVASLTVADGVVRSGANQATYASLVAGQRFELSIDKQVALKDPSTYKLVGTPVARVDIPAKVTGGLIYVHDMRLPGMLHGRIVRPPYAGRDAGDMVGKSFESVDETSIAHIPGIVKVVVLGDLVGVVAQREEHAIRAARELKVKWRKPEPLVDLSDLGAALRRNTDKQRPLKEAGDVERALQSPDTLRATYVWPYQMHASIGPSCGLASFENGKLTIWSGSQNPHNLHADVAELMKLDEANIRVVRMEASGCYGRNCADDAAAEAALLSREIGRPVRVQLMREEEHAWEPKGTAQIMEVAGVLTDKGTLAYDFVTRYPSNGSPLLAALFTGQQSSTPDVFEMGDRTAIPQYRVPDVRIVARDAAPIVRSSWIRGVAALPNVFAHESFMDELAARHNEDPVAFRLRHMEDERPIALVKAVAAKAGWQARPSPQPDAADRSKVLRGRGFSQHQYIHGKFPGVGAAWCAWAVDVEVDPATGAVRVTRVVVGQDCGLMVNPAGVKHQVHGNVLQVTSRTLMEKVAFDKQGVTSLEWGAYPILRFTDMPQIEVVLMPANGNPPLGAGESSSVPGPAAIANAIFDATGVRMREAPFTPERVKAALAAQASGVTP